MRFAPRKALAAATSAGLGLTLAVATGLAGCGGEPGLVKVTGKITYKGQPVAKGNVYFTPEKGGRAAESPLDSSGSYRLGTFDTGDGAYVGPYQVSVVSRGEDKAKPTGKKAKAVMEEDLQGTGDPLIPKKYFSPETSQLKADVPEGGGNFDFELTD
ncbi:MAG: hypothetical protein BGO49_00760 [Planctomycetales bacterium 71-10]|nr:MAG: hypothetical protein BGO49_00760 [Planctomycetales bacterium 71-10]